MAKAFNPKDHYFHRAKKEQFRARSVYKLEEIDQRFRLFRSNQKVLDLGAAPGSWTQYASQKVGEKGLVMAVDLQKIAKLKAINIQCVQADVFGEEFADFLRKENLRFDVVISDMAPKTTGIKDHDQYQSVELGIQALELADEFLKKQGIMVVKIFQGADFNDFWLPFKESFQTTKVVKPDAVRQSSVEVYAVGIGFKAENRTLEASS